MCERLSSSDYVVVDCAAAAVVAVMCPQKVKLSGINCVMTLSNVCTTNHYEHMEIVVV